MVIDASGDGLDTNGTMKMSGGTVIVNGPVSSGNGALDYDNGFPVTGGTLIAACSSGIALAPDSSSTQYFVSINCDSVLAVNTVVSIKDSAGKETLTFAPSKQF